MLWVVIWCERASLLDTLLLIPAPGSSLETGILGGWRALAIEANEVIRPPSWIIQLLGLSEP